jgi:integrase
MKNGKAFSIALSATAIEVLRAQIGKSEEYVFPKEDGTPHLWLPSWLWAKALEDAGLDDVRWHDLRHTWASLMRQSGVSLADLQEMGGWKSAKMVQRYAHLNVNHLRPMAEVMDGVLSRRTGNVQKLHIAAS